MKVLKVDQPTQFFWFWKFRFGIFRWSLVMVFDLILFVNNLHNIFIYQSSVVLLFSVFEVEKIFIEAEAIEYWPNGPSSLVERILNLNICKNHWSTWNIVLVFFWSFVSGFSFLIRRWIYFEYLRSQLEGFVHFIATVCLFDFWSKPQPLIFEKQRIKPTKWSMRWVWIGTSNSFFDSIITSIRFWYSR